MEELPTFENALRKFKDFLFRENKPGDILWVFREDVTTYKRRMWVKFPFPQDRSTLARQLYKIGVKRGFGINMNMVGQLENYSFCYIWLPVDEIEMEYAMMNGNLKLTAFQDELDVIIVKSKLKWRCLKWLNSLRGFNFLEKKFPGNIF